MLAGDKERRLQGPVVLGEPGVPHDLLHLPGSLTPPSGVPPLCLAPPVRTALCPPHLGAPFGAGTSPFLPPPPGPLFLSSVLGGSRRIQPPTWNQCLLILGKCLLMTVRLRAGPWHAWASGLSRPCYWAIHWPSLVPL